MLIHRSVFSIPFALLTSLLVAFGVSSTAAAEECDPGTVITQPFQCWARGPSIVAANETFEVHWGTGGGEVTSISATWREDADHDRPRVWNGSAYEPLQDETFTSSAGSWPRLLKLANDKRSSLTLTATDGVRTSTHTYEVAVGTPDGESPCDDGFDNDGDTLVDCDDNDCFGRDGCPYYVPCSQHPSRCDDADCIGTEPCQPPEECNGCWGFQCEGTDWPPPADADGKWRGCYCGVSVSKSGDAPFSPQPECWYGPNGQDNCDDGYSNDADDLVDCNDPDCDGQDVCELPQEHCSDGLDNDGDGLVDCLDLDDCRDKDACNIPAECFDCWLQRCDDTVWPPPANATGSWQGCWCGVTVDATGSSALGGLDECWIDPLGNDLCFDGMDNDSDSLIDCGDPSCAGRPECPVPQTATIVYPTAAGEVRWGVFQGDAWVYQYGDQGDIDHYDPEIASWGPGRLDFFAVRGEDRHLYHRVHKQGWSNWQDLGVSVGSAPDAVWRGTDKLDVFYRSANGELHHKPWRPAGWGEATSIGQTPVDAPAATAPESDRLFVVARFTDGVLWARERVEGSAWMPWEDLEAPAGMAPRVVSSEAGRVDVFTVTTAGDLVYRFRNDQGWSDWETIDTGYTNLPDVSTPTAGVFDFWYRDGADRLLHGQWADGEWSTWTAADGIPALGGNPTALAWMSHAPRVTSSETNCDDDLDNDLNYLTDCADPFCGVHSDACDVEKQCRNGIDDDDDGLMDCDDPDCHNPLFTGSIFCAAEVCDDGADNDLDDLHDCMDNECFDHAVCQYESDCNDGVDQDRDGLLDCHDREDCADDEACRKELLADCADGLDNDGDTFIDCEDAECLPAPFCEGTFSCGSCVDDDCGPPYGHEPKHGGCWCGINVVGDGQAAFESHLECWTGPTNTDNCRDGYDADNDGLVDCDDPDCANRDFCGPLETIYLVGEHPEGDLLVGSFQDRSWLGWNRLEATGVVHPPTVASRTDHRLDVFFVQEPGDRLVHRVFDGATWHEPAEVANPVTSPASPVWENEEQLHVFYRGENGTLRQRTWTRDGWQAPVDLGGNVVGAPSAVLSSPGQLDVFALHTDGTVYVRSSSSGGAWTNWLPVGTSVSHPPAAVSTQPGTVDLFILSGGQLWRRHRSAAGWEPWEPRDEGYIRMPVVSSPGMDVIDLWYRDARDVLLHQRFHSGAWSDWDTTDGEVLRSLSGAVAWPTSPVPDVPQETNCADGRDSDFDYAIDCDDSDCAADPFCALPRNPRRRILALVYGELDYDVSGVQISDTLGNAERHGIRRDLREFFESDVSQLSSGRQYPLLDLVEVGRPVGELDWSACGSVWPRRSDVETDVASCGEYDDVVVVWNAEGIEDAGAGIGGLSVAPCAEPNPGPTTSYAVIAAETLASEGRSALKRLFAEQVSSPTSPAIDLDRPETYVNCDSGRPYILDDRATDEALPGTLFHNRDGFFHDLYSEALAASGLCADDLHCAGQCLTGGSTVRVCLDGSGRTCGGDLDCPESRCSEPLGVCDDNPSCAEDTDCSIGACDLASGRCHRKPVDEDACTGIPGSAWGGAGQNPGVGSGPPGVETTPANVCSRREALVADFGAIWLWQGEDDWDQLDRNDPHALARGDVDGDASDELIVHYGGGHPFEPLYVYDLADDAWTAIAPANPRSVVAGDLNGNGKDDLILDFGPNPPAPLMIHYDDGRWVDLDDTYAAEAVTTADLDGDGRDEVVVDYGDGHGFGALLYYREGGTPAWTSISSNSPDAIAVGDVDGDGRDDLIASWPELDESLWVWLNDGVWKSIGQAAPEAIATADVDGDGRDEIIADYGPGDEPLWILFFEGFHWKHIDPGLASSPSPTYMVTGDLDGNGRDELVFEFGQPHRRRVLWNGEVWTSGGSGASQSATIGEFDGVPTL